MFIYSNLESELKIKKEVGMKKIFVVMLALFLAVPALSYAGSATSRFDMTIGGTVNINAGYFTQNMNESLMNAPRDSSNTRKSLNAETSNTYFSAADSNFNFLVKGPDAWGAKTMGFLQADFRGSNTGNGFGAAQIQWAWIKLNWSKTELQIGQHPAQAIDVWDRAFIVGGDGGWASPFTGSRPTGVALRYNWSKNFNTMIGILSPTQWTGTGAGGAGGQRQANDGYGRSGLPFGQYEIGYQSEACGKIGPHMLKFGLGGIIGKEKKSMGAQGAAAIANNITDDTLTAWLVGFRGFIPIIPEKKGNKAGALLLTGTTYIGQNMGGTSWTGVAGDSNGSYWRPNNPATNAVAALQWPTDAAAPTMYGGFVQLSYYFTDKTRINALYGFLKYNYSNWARNAAATAVPVAEIDAKGVNIVNQNRVYGMMITHDPTPQMRLGFQWQHIYTNLNNQGLNNPQAAPIISYGPVGSTLDSRGKVDTFKAAVWYFF